MRTFGSCPGCRRSPCRAASSISPETCRARAAILRLYDELRRLDLRGELDAANRSRAVDHLARIESSLGRMRLGARHHVDVYNLKIHLDMLRARLASTNESRASPAAAA